MGTTLSQRNGYFCIIRSLSFQTRQLLLVALGRGGQPSRVQGGPGRGDVGAGGAEQGGAAGAHWTAQGGEHIRAQRGRGRTGGAVHGGGDGTRGGGLHAGIRERHPRHRASPNLQPGGKQRHQRQSKRRRRRRGRGGQQRRGGEGFSTQGRGRTGQIS